MICPKCSYENPDGSTYCYLCYEPLVKPSQSPGTHAGAIDAKNIPRVNKKSFFHVRVKVFGSSFVSRIILYSLIIAGIVFTVNRYRWTGNPALKVKNEIFTIYSDLPEQRTRKYLGFCMLFRDYFNRELLPLKKKKMRMYLFRTSAGYHDFCNRNDIKLSEYGFYIKWYRLLVINHEHGIGTMLHEMVHFFIDSSGYMVPDWLNEGLAVYFEKFLGYYENESKNYVSFGYFSPWRFFEVKDVRKLKKVSFADLNSSQSIAGSFILFLNKNGRLKKFLHAYEYYRDDRKAIEAAFEQKPEVVEKVWQEWIDRQVFSDRNMMFVYASQVFDTEAEFREYLDLQGAYWDEYEKTYKVDKSYTHKQYDFLIKKEVKE